MPKYVIERDIPEAGKMSPQQLQAISQKSCGVLKDMGPQIQWVQSRSRACPARWIPGQPDLASPLHD
jgi:hypothetical protein